MSTVPASAECPEAPLFTDGLGDRVVAVDGATGDLLQILRVRPSLLAVPSFEFALRERAARLANFRHAYFARVRRIDRHPTGLAIVSDHVEGVRLSDMLAVAAERHLQLDLNAALCLLRQFVPSIALLHESARDVAHGLLAPERLIVTPRARLIVVEHVLGSAVEQLQYGRDRLWQELRVSLRSSAGAARFDHRADVTAIGLVALALVLGRPLAADEYPHRVASLLREARARSAGGDEQPLPDALHNWLARALNLDVRQGFTSAIDTQAALEDALSDDSEFVAAPLALELFLSRYSAALLEPVAPGTPVTKEKETPAILAAPRPVPVECHPLVHEKPAESPPPPVRDITELLRDFDLPQLSASHGPTTDMRPAAPAIPPEVHPRTARSFVMGWRRIAVLAIAIVALGEGVVIVARAHRTPATPVAMRMGTLSVQTNPPGVAVFVDGVARGNTPARMSLNAGSHLVELRGRGVPRVLPINVTAGAEASQYLELPETPSVGSLLVQSDPAGARVSVDGVDRGVAPASVADLAPGEHDVVLQAAGGPAVRQRVVIQAGVTSSVLTPVATATPGPVSGWLSVMAPVAIEIRENGRQIGTTDSDRIMMAAGKHDIELVNETLGYRVARSIQVPAGKVTALAVDLPLGVINLNASPWAEVWIDGRRVGETPIGNLPLSIGSHDVVFRHPQFGEKRQAVSVTLSAPVRLSVDMK